MGDQKFKARLYKYYLKVNNFHLFVLFVKVLDTIESGVIGNCEPSNIGVVKLIGSSEKTGRVLDPDPPF